MSDFRKYFIDYIKAVFGHVWWWVAGLLLALIDIAKWWFPNIENQFPTSLVYCGFILLVAIAGFQAYCDVRRRIIERAQRDIPLENAAFFALHRRWPDHDEDLSLKSEDFERFEEILRDLRQKAKDEVITIWGVPAGESGNVYDQVPAAYWGRHEIDGLEVFHMMPAKTIASTTTFLDDGPHFVDLMVSRSEIEAQWRPEKKRLKFVKPWKWVNP